MLVLNAIINTMNGSIQLAPFFAKQKKEDAQLSVSDVFEPAPALSSSALEDAILAANDALEKTQKIVHSTMMVLSCESECGRRVRNIGLELRDVHRQLKDLEAVQNEGGSIESAHMIKLRRKIWEAQGTTSQMQIQAIAESFATASPQMRAKIEAASVIEALSNGDFEHVKEILKQYQPYEAKGPVKTEADVLQRFDSKLLKQFAEKELVIRIPYEEMEDFRAELKEKPELDGFLNEALDQYEQVNNRLDGAADQDKNSLEQLLLAKEGAVLNIDKRIQDLKDLAESLDTAFYLRDHFHLSVNEPTKKMFERLVALLDVAGISIASHQRISDQILTSLFRGHFEMLCAFGVIERLTPSEKSKQVLEGKCSVYEFTKVGKDWCLITPEGRDKLKRAVLLAPQRVPKIPVPKKEKIEATKSEPTLRPQRVRDYAISRLDQSVEFY